MLKGKSLKEFKALVRVSRPPEGRDPPIQGRFPSTLQPVLDQALALTRYKGTKAKRSRMVHCVLNVLDECTGVHTKYMQQRNAAGAHLATGCP